MDMKNKVRRKLKTAVSNMNAASTWKKLVLGFAFIMFLVVLVELVNCLPYFRLSNEDKGIHAVNSDNIEAVSFNKTEKGYEFNGESGLFRIDLKGKYVDKFSYSYDYEGLMDMKVTINYHSELGKEEKYEFIDKNSTLIRQSVINIGKKVDSIELYTDTPLLLEEGITYLDLGKMPLTITGFYVNNSLPINGYRICFMLVIGILLIGAFVFHEFLGRRIEYGFLGISLLIGTLMIIMMPANKIGWDEETHFQRAYQISLYPGGEWISENTNAYFTCGIETWPFNLPQSKEEKSEQTEYMNQNAKYEGGNILILGQDAEFASTAYAFPAFVMKICRFFGLSFSALYQMGRLAGLLVYCIVMFFAIRIIPIGKRILTVIGLMPTTIFLAGCYSCDPTVIAFVSLGIALIFKETAKTEGSISWKTYLLTGIVFIWGILPKAVYAPIVLLFFLIPDERFKNKKQKYWMRIGVVLLFLALMSTFVLPELISPDISGDTRGGDVSVAKQMSLILGNPLAYAGILIKNIWATLPEYFAGLSVFRELGHIGLAGFGYFTFFYAVIIAMTDRPQNVSYQLTAGKKLWMFICASMAVVLIWTSMYLAFTVPGSTVIEGVQGRYYIPLLLLVYLCMNGEYISLKISQKTFSMIVLACSSGLLLAMLWGNFYLKFCV